MCAGEHNKNSHVRLLHHSGNQSLTDIQSADITAILVCITISSVLPDIRFILINLNVNIFRFLNFFIKIN